MSLKPVAPEARQNVAQRVSAGLTDAIPIQPQRGDSLAGNLSRLGRHMNDPG